MPKISPKKRHLSRHEELFIPWFLSSALRIRVRKMVPRYYHFRLRLYYQRYGCISCKRKDKVYGSNGLCKDCERLISDRLRYADARLKRQFEREQDGAAKIFLRRLESAKQLLADLKAIMG